MAISDDDIIERIKEAFDSTIPMGSPGEYPEEALSLGTYVKTKRQGSLGVITDAFYGDLDADNKKIIIYSVLLLPKSYNNYQSSEVSRYYLTNEYEYEITAFLMIPPIDMLHVNKILRGAMI